MWSNLRAGILVGHPMDRIKTIMQSKTRESAPRLPVSAMQLSKEIALAEGPLAFFRGLATPLLAAGPQSALLFASYTAVLRQWPSASAISPMANKSDSSTYWAGVARHLGAGAFSGLLATAILTPAELTKVVMQLDRHARPAYRSSVHCLVERTKQLGLRQGAYLGTHIMLWREIVGYALYFGVYQACRAALVPWWQTDAAAARRMQRSVDVQGDPAWAQLLAGGVAGTVSWAVIFPMDAVKTIIQSGDGRLGIMDAGRSIVQARGWGGLFHGFQICMVRGFIVNAVTFWGYETCMELITPPTRD